jgi:hypothetical protein
MRVPPWPGIGLCDAQMNAENGRGVGDAQRWVRLELLQQRLLLPGAQEARDLPLLAIGSLATGGHVEVLHPAFASDAPMGAGVPLEHLRGVQLAAHIREGLGGDVIALPRWDWCKGGGEGQEGLCGSAR